MPPPAASLTRRALAFGLDYLPISAYLGAVTLAGLLARRFARRAVEAVFSTPASGQLAGFVTVTLPVSLYFALSEASERGGTWGKRRIGVRVVTAGGGRLSLARAALRTGLKLLPWELAHTVVWRLPSAGADDMRILVGGLVAVWVLVGANLGAALLDPDGRAVYDRLAGTRVVLA